MNKRLTKSSKIAIFIIAVFVMLFMVRIIQGATRTEEPFFIPLIAIITVLIGVIGQLVSPSYCFSFLATAISLFAGVSVYIEFICHYGFNVEFLSRWFMLIAGTFTAHLALLVFAAYFSLKVRQLLGGVKT